MSVDTGRRTSSGALTLMPARAEVLTVELKSNLLAPVRSGTVKARGEVLRDGRVLTVCHGDAFEVVGDEATHVATMLGTMIAREEDAASTTSRG
jgi:acyl-coenzyme A thioesterase PaaI-like protein